MLFYIPHHFFNKNHLLISSFYQLRYDKHGGDKMNLKQYLKRLNESQEMPSFDYLSRLQYQHVTTIPFENLDVIRKVPIYLNLATIESKILENGRGGYCYELNGLFQALLKKLGYDAHLISATVLRPNGEWAKADTHAAILVHLDKPYLVDVGFGAKTPRVPVPLNGMNRTNIGETYAAKQVSENTFDLMRTTNDSSRVLYRFTLSKKDLIDFHEGCVFNQVSKDSTFTHTDIISLATEDGRITLQDDLLTEVKKYQSKKTYLSAAEKEQVLANIFTLSLK